MGLGPILVGRSGPTVFIETGVWFGTARIEANRIPLAACYAMESGIRQISERALEVWNVWATDSL